MDRSPFPRDGYSLKQINMLTNKSKYPNRKGIRLKDYDYSQYGFYFITICLIKRKQLFSQIRNNKVLLSEFGVIVEEILLNIPKYYNAEIDCYVIMPDHIHLILIIDNFPEQDNSKEKISKTNTLSEVIGKFKSFSTKKIREKIKDRNEFEWQQSFYDRIIRNEKELFQFRKYIDENPIRWEIEKYYPENLEM